MTTAWTQPFGTFVYSPDVAVYVASEKAGVIDLSPDIVKTTVYRRANQVSSASFVLNNKYRKYDAVLQRMDRVTVFMKRTSWVQVFSGYLTTVPYITVVPGTIVVEAECTLRRLSHTYWDPTATENVDLFFPKIGGTVMSSPDSGTSATMFKLLTQVAAWDPSNIWIQKIPIEFIEKVAAVAATAQSEWDAGENQTLIATLQTYLGTGWAGGAPVTAPGVASTQLPLAGDNPVKVLPAPKQYFSNVPKALAPGGFGNFRAWPSPHTHQGVDIMIPLNTPLYACATGRVEKTPNDWGGNALKVYDQKGNYFYYAHANSYAFQEQQRAVTAGEVIAYVGHTGDTQADHLHFEYHPNNGSAVDPYAVLTAAYNGYVEDPARATRDGESANPLPDANTPSELGAASAPGVTATTVASSAPFNYAWSTFETDIESEMYRGDRAWLNDVPLQESITTICSASLRSYQSGPGGDFVAWFPDKYGFAGKTPALQIRDIEIQDFKVSISDKNLRTHVAVAGTRVGEDPTVGLEDWLRTIGIVSVQKPEIMKILLGLDPGKEYEGLDGADLLKRFGMRPYRQESQEVHDPVWEFFLAYQLFQQFWTAQFSASVQFTFMPELYPGMRVELVDRNLAFYVEQVDHSCDRGQGFTTNAQISCPMVGDGAGGWKILPIEVEPKEVPFDQAQEVRTTRSSRLSDFNPGILQ